MFRSAKGKNRDKTMGRKCLKEKRKIMMKRFYFAIQDYPINKIFLRPRDIFHLSL